MPETADAEATYDIEQRRVGTSPYWTVLASGYADPLMASMQADFFRTTRPGKEFRVVKRTVLFFYAAQEE